MQPGSHLTVLSDDAMTGIEGRVRGLELRDTLLVLRAGPRVSFVFLFRVPFDGTVAEQVVATETGGLNIEACRVGLGASQGRWPPNILLLHDLGCVPGFARVEGHKGYKNGPGGSSSQFSQKGTPTTRTAPWAGHADADGKETVPAWDCEAGCPVKALDAQSGAARFYPQFGSEEELRDWVWRLVGYEFSNGILGK